MAKKMSSPVQRDSDTPSPKDGFWARLNPVEWFRVVLDFVSKNLPQIPERQRTPVLLAALGAVIALAGSIMLFRRGQDLFGVTLLLATLLLFAYAMRHAQQPSRISAPQEPSGPARKSPTGAWSRVTVKVPIQPEMLKELAGQVRTVRDLAKTKYSALLGDRKPPPSQTDPESVRANVFLPDTRNVLYGEVCALFIPKWLHHGMKNDAERGLRFRPDEGVTGRVFTREQPIGTRRTSATEEWEWIHLEGSAEIGDDEFQLTQVQMRLIDKNLRWIVSFPLMVDVTGKRHAVGVLNVDGLSEVLTSQEMQTIYHTLKPTVEDFAKRLAGLPKCRITITVEDIAAEAAESTG